MADSSWSDPLPRLVPEVQRYASAQFVLINDLTHLLQAQRADIPEAVILYAARILEVLSAQALQALGLPAGTNPFGNLVLLQQYNLLPTVTGYWAHALRRLGNAVRHIHRVMTGHDADLAAASAERVLHWFFCTLPCGSKLPALTRDREPLGAGRDRDLLTMLGLLDREETDLGALAEQYLAGRHLSFFQTPVVPAVLAEKLLDRKEHAHAGRVLAKAIQGFGEDLRLRQLLALYWSRVGDVEEAVRCLETLHASAGDDEETTGILAGVYKRRWQVHREQLDWLEQAHRLYRHGWERARKTSPYLGINAATTALWLGNGAHARRLAAEVQALLLDRAGKLAGHGSENSLTLNYWDHVTLAEAQLLLGRFASSRQTYREAFERYAEQQGNIEVSRRQAVEILGALGHATASTEAFFESFPSERQPEGPDAHDQANQGASA
jgi:tetratricopeptide (TPR) repeat protein